MPDGKHIPASEFHTRFSITRDKEVEELWEKVKDRPGLDKALDDLRRAGFFPPSWIIRRF
jgi:hypothetical protein